MVYPHFVFLSHHLYDEAMRFLLILSFLFAYSCFKTMQLNPSAPYLMIMLCLLFFVLMLGPTILSRNKPDMTENFWFSLSTWLGSTFIGFYGTFIMISIPIDIVHVIFNSFSDIVFLSTSAYQLIFLVAFLMSLLGFIEVLRGPKVVEVEVPLENLSADLKNFKIAQISDLHIGPTIQSRYVKKVVTKTNAANPDIIVITGDLVDSHTEKIKKHLQPLAELKARYGVFYVTGNHEYYWGVESLLPELQKVGLTVLDNTNKLIEVNDARILLAGVPDPMAGHISSTHKPNISRARENAVESDIKILLAHRPDPYKEAESVGFDLQFSGHTHAGQFFPFSLLIPFAHKYYRGLNQYKKMWLYVNPGTGHWGPPNRFGIASEITLATLTSK
jgi:predicted MPP superfamily phosphohydrolase